MMQPQNLSISVLLVLFLTLSLGCGEETEPPATPPSIDDPQILTPQAIAEIALQSTVFLQVKKPENQITSASGFVIGEGLIVTSYHIAENMLTGSTARLVKSALIHPIGAIVAVDQAHDLAILKSSGISALALALGDSDMARIGDTVYVTGNPDGYVGSFSEGIIGGLRPDGGGWGKGALIQITAPISKGSSGGPVLNGQGEVIGVAMGGDLDGQNLNFAIPVNFLKELLAAQ